MYCRQCGALSPGAPKKKKKTVFRTFENRILLRNNYYTIVSILLRYLFNCCTTVRLAGTGMPGIKNIYPIRTCSTSRTESGDDRVGFVTRTPVSRRQLFI